MRGAGRAGNPSKPLRPGSQLRVSTDCHHVPTQRPGTDSAVPGSAPARRYRASRCARTVQATLPDVHGRRLGCLTATLRAWAPKLFVFSQNGACVCVSTWTKVKDASNGSGQAQQGAAGGSGPHRTRPGRGRRRTLLITGVGLAAAIAAVGVFELIPRQASGHPAADTRIAHSATPTAGGQPVFVGHPAVAGAPVPDPTPSGNKKHPGSGPPMPTGVPGDWKLVFDDEFNGAGLNTSEWSTGWLGSGITGPVNAKTRECYDPSQVAVGGGSLNLTLVAKSESCGISDPEYATGLVNTAGKFTYTYGFLEARVWLPGANGAPNMVANWQAVWTDGRTGHTTAKMMSSKALAARRARTSIARLILRGRAPVAGRAARAGCTQVAGTLSPRTGNLDQSPTITMASISGA